MDIEYTDWVKELNRPKTPLEKAMERAWVYVENQSICNMYLWAGTSEDEQKLLKDECARLWMELVNVDPRGTPIGKAFIKSFNKKDEDTSDDVEPKTEPVTNTTTKPTGKWKKKK